MVTNDRHTHILNSIEIINKGRLIVSILILTNYPCLTNILLSVLPILIRIASYVMVVTGTDVAQWSVVS